MKKYLIAIIFITTLVLGGYSQAKAETMDELLAEVKNLKAQVSQLSSQLSAMALSSMMPDISAPTLPNITEADKAAILNSLSLIGTKTDTSASTTNSFASLPSISSIMSAYLAVGQSSTDVRALQTLLSQKGFLSTDNITGYYGSATTAAVKRLQESNGIVSDGTVVGPQTKAVLAGTSSVDTSTKTPTITTVPLTTETKITTIREGGPISKDCKAVITAVTVTVDSTTPPARTYRAGTLGHDAGHFKVTSNCPVTVTQLVATPNYSATKLTANKPPVSLYYFYDGSVLLGAGKTGIYRSTGYFTLGAGQSKVITVRADMTPQKLENQFQINLGVSTSASGSTMFTSPFANWF